MNDLELMRYAAMAAISAGMDVTICPWESIDPFSEGVDYFHGDEFWMPLEDDADAMLLVAGLKLDIAWRAESTYVEVFNAEKWVGCRLVIRELFFPDSRSALRRAIVRASAEIGKKAP